MTRNQKVRYGGLRRGRLNSSRAAKFALVGVIGIAVQLGTLYLLNSFRWNYVIATGAAVEAALLHNFVWHENFTWRDRNQESSGGFGPRLLRFHLSNGAISLAGNMLLTWIFTGALAIPLIFANLLSITVCCFTNFLASDRWVFAKVSDRKPQGESARSAIRSKARCANGE